MQPVEPFSSKARAWDKIKMLKFPSSVTVDPPFFYQNLENAQHPLDFQRQANRVILANFPLLAPNDRVAFFDVCDIGTCTRMLTALVTAARSNALLICCSMRQCKVHQEGMRLGALLQCCRSCYRLPTVSALSLR